MYQKLIVVIQSYRAEKKECFCSMLDRMHQQGQTATRKEINDLYNVIVIHIVKLAK